MGVLVPHSAELSPKQINIEQKYGKQIFVGPPPQLGHITEHCGYLFTSWSLFYFPCIGLEDEQSQASVKVTAAQISWDLTQAESRRECGAPAPMRRQVSNRLPRHYLLYNKKPETFNRIKLKYVLFRIELL